MLVLGYISLFVFFILGMLKLPLEYTGVFLLLALYIINGVKTKKWGWDSVIGRYAVFFFVISGSLMAGFSQALDKYRFLKEAQKYWGSFLVFILAYMLIKNRIVLTKYAVKFFVGGLFVTSVLGWFRMIPHLRYLGFADRLSRLDTPLGICNNYASVLIAGLLILINLKKNKRILFLSWIDTILIVFFSASVVFAQSDAALLGISAGVLLIICDTKDGFRYKRFALMISVLLVIFVGLVIVAKPYFLRRGNAVRIGLWGVYGETALEKPLTGVGLRQMRKHYDDWKRPIPFGYEDELPAMDAHNFVLQYAAENGIPAALILLIFLGYYFTANLSHRGRWFGIYCGLAAFLVQALFSNNFLIIRQMMYFWFFMGVRAAETELSKERTSGK